VPSLPDADITALGRGPAVLKKRLGEELRSLRTNAGMTVAQTATELDCGEGKVRHMENGRNVPSKSDLTVMIALYGAPPEVHEGLEDLRKAAARRGWWSAYRLPSWLHNYVGLEADAIMIRNFEVELIPGLLQIEPYARAAHALGPRVLDPQEVERRVTARLKRQELLSGDSPVIHHAIISEAALHRLRGTEYAQAQYRHLLTMSQKPNVTITVLPFSAGLHQGMSGGFILLDFLENVSAPVAYYDHATGGQLEHDPQLVARMSEVYNQLTALAMSAEEATAFLTQWLEEQP
jgi:transcriptional regulator with XRE-family HTH domain